MVSGGEGDDNKKKSHRERHAGRKATRKKEKKGAQNPVEDQTARQRNPKAFTFNSAIRAERRFRRKQDIDTKKQHIPLVDRTPIEPPPVMVAVVGPPKVGKSTLINNLIKLYTRSPLVEIKGPVTLVIGKKRRITFVECNNDINSMIDLAKVADLVLLLCDASFGFEMEVFEFLNVCQVHGMPRIMGVLTHLDMIKNVKALKNTKKVLKHRFWTEVYQGAKLFYLSGIIHEEYLRNEIKNLGRFISVMKFRPLTWRSTHGYLLGDRYEDLTNQEVVRKNPKCDRNISLYGYIRGVPIKKQSSVHIAGLGDLRIHDISYLPDPCPLPEQIKKRALVEKEKLIYAPFSGVGGIVYDKDAVYVELGGSHSHNQRDEEDETDNIVTNLIETKQSIDAKMEHSKLQLFTGSKQLTAKDFEAASDKDTDDEESEEEEEEEQEQMLLFEQHEEKKDEEGLDGELKELREESKKKLGKLQEEKVEDSGRVRRKVVFETGDEEFSGAISESGEESEDEDEEAEDETNGDGYVVLKENKDEGVRSKISDILKKLDQKKVPLSSSSKPDQDEGESSNSDNDLAGDESGSEDDLSEDESDLEGTGEEKMLNVDSDGEDIGEKDDSDDEQRGSGDTGGKKNDEEDDQSGSEDEDGDVRWKDNLARKAQEAFLARQNTTQNLTKLVYGVFDVKNQEETEELQDEDDDEDNEIDGLFKNVSRRQQKLKMDKDTMNLTESSLMEPWNSPNTDWIDHQNKARIVNCFVTGTWKKSEDAEELLRLDDAEDLSDVDSELYGDFEDLETGTKHTAQPKEGGTKKRKQPEEEAKKRKRPEDEKDIQADRQALAEKKRKLKEKFDEEYDNVDNKGGYYDDLKAAADKQAQLNRSVFENLADDVRVQIEGFRPGMYVRIEFRDVPSEFVTNFDPTYPLVVGALNMGEENVGFINVRIKKHRWYSRILKTCDPLIVSLGWRRFQTLPLYSKLEDDLKYRYLKYTPQHLACHAHFWGPITPQGTGFLALQSVESNPEMLKKQGFRIAATGVVQELDKSTQVMKKLKLIGYPIKIYKKTAFIKGMFNSTLEVAKFEGARLKTVSGIRGQIKKAVSKPEGCFRATFEDKILLSDIVFCRTWYKTDVPEFYNPVTTLLLPPDRKNSWRGVRTTGEVKREKGIKNASNKDSLYTPVKRQPKPFKPLVVPSKLQRALPYKDKPKMSVKASERKKGIDRVAVIKEPHEQKVSKMMKMIKTVYEHKQEKMKLETKERLEKHRQMVEAQELQKDKKLKQKKKEVFRRRSKAENSKKNR